MRSGDMHGGWSRWADPEKALAEGLTGPEFLPVTGGTALIARRSRVLLSGESGEGKTWAALALAVEHLRAGERVFWLDANAMGPDGIARRLRLLGASADDIEPGDVQGRRWPPTGQPAPFRYTAMSEVRSRADLPALAGDILHRPPGLLVVDGWEVALTAAGLWCEHADDRLDWHRIIERPVFERGGVVLNVCGTDSAHASIRAGKDAHLRIEEARHSRFAPGRDGLFWLDVRKDHDGHMRAQADAFLLSLSHREGGIRWDVRPEEVVANA